MTPRAAPGAWSETVLYNFQGAAEGDGYYPAAGLLIGDGGALYGTTPADGIEGWGTVFRLSAAAPEGTPRGRRAWRRMDRDSTGKLQHV